MASKPRRERNGVQELQREGDLLGKFRDFVRILGARRTWDWRHIGGGGLFGRYVMSLKDGSRHEVAQATAQAWRRRGWIDETFEHGRGYHGWLTDGGREVLRDAA